MHCARVELHDMTLLADIHAEIAVHHFSGSFPTCAVVCIVLCITSHDQDIFPSSVQTRHAVPGIMLQITLSAWLGLHPGTLTHEPRLHSVCVAVVMISPHAQGTVHPLMHLDLQYHLLSALSTQCYQYVAGSVPMLLG